MDQPPPETKRTVVRSWPRFHVQLPVLITAHGQASEISVPGLVGEISRRGMALYAGIRSHPGERMQVDFTTSSDLRVSAVVRNCNGYCLGLEFLGSENACRQEIMLEAFLYSHERYLQSRIAETDRIRKRILKIRQMRQEIEMLLRSSQVSGLRLKR